jgi:predicted AlkP superfamily phosphohydrolase/phosphomutase
MKTVLLGLDGATFTILDHLVAEGVMPNLAELYRKGARGDLMSTPTPLTPQAWTSLATGRSPGHHGIIDFLRPEHGPHGVYWRLNDSREIHCETIWKYASRHGRRVTVLNYIYLSPPEPIHGHTIPGFTSGRHLRRSSYPPNLFERLQQVPGLDVKALGMDLQVEQEALQEMEPQRWCEWIRHHIERERIWFGILEHLMAEEPSDLTAIVLDGVDKIQHLAYRFLDPALLPQQPTPWETEVIATCRDYFRQVDQFLGAILRRIGRWGRVFLASDHGFAATTEVVYINKWLYDQGWLHWRGEFAEDEKLSNFGDRLANLANAIDLPRSQAYALTPSINGILIVAPPEERGAIRAEIAGRLLDLRGPDGGRVVTEVRTREEVFPGPFVDRAPDLLLTLRDHGFVSVLNARAAVISRRQPAGTHHPRGVLVGIGPGIREGASVGPLSILDVAPLLLHSLGLEIPRELEGTFPSELYDPDYLTSDPVRWGVTAGNVSLDQPPPSAPSGEPMDDQDEAYVIDQLRKLGYLE